MFAKGIDVDNDTERTFPGRVRAERGKEVDPLVDTG